MQCHISQLHELKEIEVFLLKLFQMKPGDAYKVAYSTFANVIANNSGLMLKKFF